MYTNNILYILIIYMEICEFYANELSRKRDILASKPQKGALKWHLKCVCERTTFFSLI